MLYSAFRSCRVLRFTQAKSHKGAIPDIYFLARGGRHKRVPQSGFQDRQEGTRGTILTTEGHAPKHDAVTERAQREWHQFHKSGTWCMGPAGSNIGQLALQAAYGPPQDRLPSGQVWIWKE